MRVSCVGGLWRCAGKELVMNAGSLLLRLRRLSVGRVHVLCGGRMRLWTAMQLRCFVDFVAFLYRAVIVELSAVRQSLDVLLIRSLCCEWRQEKWR